MPRDAIALAALLATALLLMAQSGFKRAVELMPWPDGLEYAAAAVSLDQGRGAELHFGGYSYPSRYTEGYPLILAAAYPILGHDVAELGDATVAMGLLAIVALYLLTLGCFGRASAFAAGILMAVSPVFVTYSTLVLSDVPALAVAILAALALARASRAQESSSPSSLSGTERQAALVYWAIFGFLAGFAVMIRPTSATMLAGLVVAFVAVRPAGWKSRSAVASLAALAIGFAPLPLWQARENFAHLGSAFASGYAWWVPEVYGSLSRTFNAAFLLGPTMPRNPYGNLPVYMLTLCGLDGLIDNPGAPHFYLYPFAAAVFATIGFVSIIGSSRDRVARRVVIFGLGFLCALVAAYSFYVFTEIAFILPGCFIVFSMAGCGGVIANRRLAAAWSRQRRSIAGNSLVAAIVVLDLLLAAAIGREMVDRLSVPPPESEVVPALRLLDRSIERDATVVSNISLQFLELYVLGARRDFVGMHSFDPGGDFNDYHLGRLYALRAQGWRGPVPPVLFDGAGMIAGTADSIASQVSAGRPAYLLLWTPSSPEYEDILKEELDRIADRFSIGEVARAAPLVLYRLRAR